MLHSCQSKQVQMQYKLSVILGAVAKFSLIGKLGQCCC